MYKAIYTKLLEETVEVSQITQGFKMANLNTFKSTAFLCSDNFVHNLSVISQTLPVNAFKDLFKNKPAVVVSAGPSLTPNIEFIKKYRDKIILFCVGTALKALAKHKITPDFVCSTEPQPTLPQFEGVDLSDSFLIIEPVTSTEVCNLQVKSKILYCSPDNELNDFFAKNVGLDNSQHESSGTVSFMALNCAKIMGCNPLILIGQDLAYTQGTCYSPDSAYPQLKCVYDEDSKSFKIIADDFDAYVEALKGKNSDISYQLKSEYAKKYLDFLNQNIFTVMGQNGEMLPTQTGYALFIKAFENFAEKNHDIKLINSSTGGAQINGFENIPLQEALVSYTKSKIKCTLPEIPLNYNISNLKTTLQEEVMLMKASRKLIEGGFDILRKIKNEFNHTKIFDKTCIKLFRRIIEIFNILDVDFYQKSAIFKYSVSTTFLDYHDAISQETFDIDFKRTDKLIDTTEIFFKTMDYLAYIRIMVIEKFLAD